MAGRSTDEADEGGRSLDDTVPASDAPADAPAAAVRPAPRAARYQLGAELGRGGMGRVVEAFDAELGRTVALKEVLPKAGPGAARRFAREVQLTARLEHPSIVPLYDAGVTADGRPYYVMRRVTGQPLDQLIARARGVPERLTLLPAVLSAIDAVAHAHRRGVIHRDLKPANILVGELGETVVIDWGLAKVLDEDDDRPAARDSLKPSDSLLQLETQVGSVFGTPGFMAPEQARGEDLDPRSDVYALGATLYQLLAGKPPHAGTSATEVLANTVDHAIAPLDTIAPGAPAELVTIVSKALARDPAQRYPDAGALGEDVRRFLAGQLVAAHRYTAAQKLGRFARRHRAPLAVAALALVAVAVLAWVGVHRIMRERDAANTARASAERNHHAVARANQALAERHDALLVTQARALLDTNPTHALAVLKQLAPTSSRLDEARAVAQAAVARGVGWALPTSDAHVVIADLSIDGRYLAQTTVDGAVHVWDLDRRRRVLERTYPRGTRAVWVAGGKLFVHGRERATELVDPVTGAAEPLALPALANVEVSDDGSRVLVVDGAPSVGLYDVTTRTLRPLARIAPQTMELAPDGSIVAYSDDRELVVVAADGRELARRPAAQRIVISAHRTVAAVADNVVHELVLDPRPAWRAVPFEIPGAHQPVDLVYRDRELLAWVSTGTLLGWSGKVVYPRASLPRITSSLGRAGDGLVTVASGDGRIHVFGAAIHASVVLPTQVPELRFARRGGVSRLVAVGRGVIVGFELATFVPRTITTPPATQLRFLDEGTALAWQQTDPAWAWIDLATGRRTPMHGELIGIIEFLDVDPAGRMLVRDGIPERGRLWLVDRGIARPALLAEGRGVWGRLVAGGGVIYGADDGRVLARIGDEPAREVVKLDGRTSGAVSLGPLRFAAASTAGELVRGELRGGALERARVDGAGFVAADGSGRVFIAIGARLLMWDRGVDELAVFDKPIVYIAPVEGGLAVTLRDHEVQLIEPRPGARPRRVLAAGEQFPEASSDGRLVVGVGHAAQVEIVELPTRARWNLPMFSSVTGAFSLAPRARRVMRSAPGVHVIWDLPQAGPDLAAWLDEQTNGVVDDDGVLGWSWQTR